MTTLSLHFQVSRVHTFQYLKTFLTRGKHSVWVTCLTPDTVSFHYSLDIFFGNIYMSISTIDNIRIKDQFNL